jgi:hypothetical protein
MATIFAIQVYLRMYPMARMVRKAFEDKVIRWEEQNVREVSRAMRENTFVIDKQRITQERKIFIIYAKRFYVTNNPRHAHLRLCIDL